MTDTDNEQSTVTPWHFTLAACQRLIMFIDSLGISPGEVARCMKAPGVEIKKIEQGKRIVSIDWIIEILTMAGIDPTWLITGSVPLTREKALIYAEMITLMDVPEVRLSILDELKKAQNALNSKIKKKRSKGADPGRPPIIYGEKRDTLG